MSDMRQGALACCRCGRGPIIAVGIALVSGDDGLGGSLVYRAVCAGCATPVELADARADAATVERLRARRS